MEKTTAFPLSRGLSLPPAPAPGSELGSGAREARAHLAFGTKPLDMATAKNIPIYKQILVKV